MSAVKLFLVRCDYCGYIDEQVDGMTIGAARRALRAAGWTRPRAHEGTVLRTDACAICSGEPLTVRAVGSSSTPTEQG